MDVLLSPASVPRGKNFIVDIDLIRLISSRSLSRDYPRIQGFDGCSFHGITRAPDWCQAQARTTSTRLLLGNGSRCLVVVSPSPDFASVVCFCRSC
ncbi:hypothetical protein C0Q70_14266 [Pomacea canaliculata]|uniref:Uncharacterized protein n=1 Tax=Pomacea canaliculata TaxID=400727 RepID=A0A2T7NZI9_POMCA|nr:hypothetical protein C0Q70_14266 [Pomacea canaliculata]